MDVCPRAHIREATPKRGAQNPAEGTGPRGAGPATPSAAHSLKQSGSYQGSSPRENRISEAYRVIQATRSKERRRVSDLGP